MRNDVAWFDEEENNSSLVAARLATEATDVKSAIAERISVILQNMTSLLVSFVVGFIIEWRVAILILVTFPLLVLANFAQVKTLKHQPWHNEVSLACTVVTPFSAQATVAGSAAQLLVREERWQFNSSACYAMVHS